MSRKKHLVLTGILCLLCVGFIWGNSHLPGDESGAISSGLLLWLQSLLPPLGGMSEYLLRKLGHFCEFAGLGFLTAHLCRLLGERKLHAIAMPLLLCLLTAAGDETIQIFVEGRGSSLIDVWIDTAGALTGIAVLLLAGLIIGKANGGKAAGNTERKRIWKRFR